MDYGTEQGNIESGMGKRPTQRQMVILRMRCGPKRMSDTKIAAALGIKPVTVRVSLSRSRKALAGLGLMEEGDTWDDIAELIGGLK